jgi:hypothetical protein
LQVFFYRDRPFCSRVCLFDAHPKAAKKDAAKNKHQGYEF